MKIEEIASAEDQLALWQLVSDNVWSAIRTQAKQEAERKAVIKPKSASAKKAAPLPYAAPPPPLPKPNPLYPKEVSKPKSEPPTSASLLPGHRQPTM